MNDKIKELERIKNEALSLIAAAGVLEALDEIRNRYLSKKGEISLLMSQLKDLSPEDRPKFGLEVNVLKNAILDAFYEKKSLIENETLEQLMLKERVDVTLPGYSLNGGSIHPLNQAIEEIEDIFVGMGYKIAEGPEVESDLYNFEMMNMQEDHPARDMQDSFYIDVKTLLRTHTSPVQARTMLENKGEPLKIICPGRVYRRDYDDQTHSHEFTQIEGLVVGPDITFGNLKDALLKMVRALLGDDKEIRLRPSYFPFTEPSCEVDVLFSNENGKKTYIELLGAGMVHPNVLKMGGYDPEKVSGFAFGIGIERLVVLRYGIENIRNFYLNDLRFLKQFKGV